MHLENIKRRAVVGVLAGAMLSAVPTMAAVDYYMTITGTKQGQIKGGASEKLSVSGVSHDMRMTSEMAAGKRQHGAITIRREVDAASPKLFQALSTNEVLGNVTIVFGAGAARGKSVRSITLTDATIASDRKAGGSELITFEYSKILVTWNDGGKTATDDWLAPN